MILIPRPNISAVSTIQVRNGKLNVTKWLYGTEDTGNNTMYMYTKNKGPCL